MNRQEAIELANKRFTGVKRPKSETPDERPERLQLIDHEFANFEGRMAEHALKVEKFPPHHWFTDHRARFRKTMAERYPEYPPPKDDPPCKHWESKAEYDPDLLKILKKTWDQNILKWALKHPYLASPTAPCECRGCMKRGPSVAKVRDQWGFDEEMVGPA